LLEKKKVLLSEEIEQQKLRGISPEDFKEIEENFKKFDKDNSNSIDKKELRACLYSLGEEKTKSQIEALINEYGKDGRIQHNRFVDLMVTFYGNDDSKQQILDGFKLINRGEVALVDKLQRVMENEDITYITSTAPKKESGYDYSSWTNEVFSR